jgi:putative transposase
MTANRKHVKHYHEPGDLHELTFSCYGRRTLLDDDKARTLLCESISAQSLVTISASWLSC